MFNQLYDVICRDECGQEMVIVSGVSKDDAQKEVKEGPANYPECRRFEMTLNARQAAEYNLTYADEYGMTAQDYYDDHQDHGGY